MKPIDIILIAALALIVGAIVAYIVRKKIKGEKIGCGCGCQSCPHASVCGGNKPAQKTENTEEKGGSTHDETV